MGCQFRFECQKCGYAAEVSGGRDAGFVARTATMYCRTCRELRDVAIHGKDANPARTSSEADDDDDTRCPRCDGADLVAWQGGNPCPHCQGRVEKRGLVMLWD